MIEVDELFPTRLIFFKAIIVLHLLCVSILWVWERIHQCLFDCRFDYDYKGRPIQYVIYSLGSIIYYFRKDVVFGFELGMGRMRIGSMVARAICESCGCGFGEQ